MSKIMTFWLEIYKEVMILHEMPYTKLVSQEIWNAEEENYAILDKSKPFKLKIS